MNTVLAPLLVSDLNSSLVESTESYIVRLAGVHCVSPRKVIHLVGAIGSHVGQSNREALKPFAAQSGGRWFEYNDVCGYSNTAASFIGALSLLTGQNELRCTSLVAFQNLFARNGGSCFFRYRRWCPLCYYENKNSSEPLCWGLKFIHRCEVHDCLLESECRLCHATQNRFRPADVRTSCKRCKESLGSAHGKYAQLSEWDNWGELRMREIIAFTANPENEAFSPNVFERFKNALLADQKQRSNFSKIGTIDCRNILRPRVDTLFRYSAYQMVRPLDLLLRPEEAASPIIIDDNWDIKITAPRLFRGKQFYDDFSKHVEDLLQNAHLSPLPNVKELCKQFSMFRSHFFQRCRTLHGRYTEALRLQDLRVKENSHAYGLLMARLEIDRRLKAHEPIALLSIAAAIQKRGILSKHLARECVRVVFEEMNSKSDSA